MSFARGLPEEVLTFSGTEIWAGLKFHGYRLEKMIGRSLWSSVWRATKVDTNRPVALKVFSDLAGSFWRPYGMDRIRYEVEVMGRLAHPNIMSILDSRLDISHPFFTMPIVQGQTLETLKRKLSWRNALRLMQRVCVPVQFMHQHGVIHRDLKPEHIYVESAGHGKATLIDLSYVGELVDPPEHQRHEPTIGRKWHYYQAPEEVGGCLAFTERTDVYTLGLDLFELLTGWLPSTGTSWLADGIRQVGLKGSDKVPDSLEPVLTSACNKNPDKRFATVAAFSDALSECLSH